MSIHAEDRPAGWAKALRTIALMGLCQDALAITLDEGARAELEHVFVALGGYADKGREVPPEVGLQAVMILARVCPSIEVDPDLIWRAS